MEWTTRKETEFSTTIYLSETTGTRFLICSIAYFISYFIFYIGNHWPSFLEHFSDFCSLCEEFSVKISSHDVSIRSLFSTDIEQKRNSEDFDTSQPRYAYLQFHRRCVSESKFYVEHNGHDKTLQILLISWKVTVLICVNLYLLLTEKPKFI